MSATKLVLPRGMAKRAKRAALISKVGVYFRGGLFSWGFISVGVYFRGGLFSWGFISVGVYFLSKM